MADTSAQAIGAWLHGAATGAAHAVGSFNDWVQAQPTLQQGISGLATGLATGSSEPQPSSSVTVQLPPASVGGAAAPAFYASPAAAQARANGQAMTAADIMGLGKLSPAAQTVLQANSPQTLAAAQTAQNKAAAGQPGRLSPADMAALGGLSFRQLGMLGDLALKTSPAKDVGRGAVTSTADLAAQQMLGLNQPQFEAAMKAVDANKTITQQDKDAQKQKLIGDYSKNTLVPIMARGNDPLAQMGVTAGPGGT